MENKKVSVKIFGEVYTFSTNKSEDYLNKIAEYVDKHMWKACTSVKDPRNNKVQLLAAINIAEEHFETKASINDYRKRIISNEETITYYKDVLEEIDREKNRLNIENQAAKQLCVDKEQQIYELNSRLEALESTLFDIQNQNVKLGNEISKLEYENEELKSSKEDLNLTIVGLNGNVTELNSTITELNSTIEELKASIPSEPPTVLDELKDSFDEKTTSSIDENVDNEEMQFEIEEEGSLFSILADPSEEKE